MQNHIIDKQSRYKKTKHVLGEGSYKTVSKAIDEEEGKEVAYNEVRIKNYEDETQSTSSFSKEIALLKSVDHPNIIKILDYWFSEENFIFITELMSGGTLKEYIQSNGPLSLKLIRKWGKQILYGLRYLHTLDPPIIHRDVKNDNIFVNTAIGEVKIGDLGLARERKHKRYTIVGTPHFMAREMFEGDGYTEKIDIYAFGMCLIEMATGKTPYIEFRDTKEIYKSVLQGILPKALQIVMDPCLKSLVMSCLVPSNVRYTTAQCLDHHFFHPEVICTGDCIPGESVTVYPLQFQPIKDMELSIVSVFGGKVIFQILLLGTMKFIKFEYDLQNDTIKKICDELLAEKIVDESCIEAFSSLLSAGLTTVENKLETGQIHDGVIGLDPIEIARIKDMDMLIRNKKSNEGNESPFQSISFGTSTLEEMRLIEESMKIEAARKEVEKKREEELSMRLKSRLHPKVGGVFPIQENEIEADFVGSIEMTKSVKFKNEGMPHTEFVTENIYMQFPNALSEEDGVKRRLQNLTVSPQSKQQRVDSVLEPTPRSPTINSPQFGVTKVTEEQIVNDDKLNESYEQYKQKYKNNYSISQYALDVAMITGRTEDNAKAWLKTLKDEDIETVFDLKLMVYEDWEKLPLTVFSCRAMQNMLYGIDGVPLKEKQLPLNPKLKEYENRISIKSFLEDICEQINRKELVTSWEDCLLAQDIQTVGELKSLHYEDWNRLGLTAYAYRILKNVIFRKGKIVVDP
ncbi:hypothetical protein GINT2_002189 [Glugoides intestinalis]